MDIGVFPSKWSCCWRVFIQTAIIAGSESINHRLSQTNTQHWITCIDSLKNMDEESVCFTLTKLENQHTLNRLTLIGLPSKCFTFLSELLRECATFLSAMHFIWRTLFCRHCCYENQKRISKQSKCQKLFSPSAQFWHEKIHLSL